jgi:hypothetical protein
MEEPKRVMPNTEKVLPSRAKLRSEKDDPMFKMSKTANEDPQRPLPKSENVEPRRQKLLSDKELPPK